MPNRGVYQRLSECAEDIDSVEAVMVQLRTHHHSANPLYEFRLFSVNRYYIQCPNYNLPSLNHTSAHSLRTSSAMINRFFELLPSLIRRATSRRSCWHTLRPSGLEVRGEGAPGIRRRPPRRSDFVLTALSVKCLECSLPGKHTFLICLRILVLTLFNAAPRADIVHMPDFETGFVRVQKGQAKRLTRAEKEVPSNEPEQVFLHLEPDPPKESYN
ncbi:hypothetical protein GN958_ATG06849 [Phytophthora infestans]|uniref:Uncharacterized protein n=1 Tax=Phytophthora infestans TaxID=4787 RepID=A0A8S9UXL3_PHYIN|nr:hypothetical protein GN958_ATG06849 [Phytophthora infestans]